MKQVSERITVNDEFKATKTVKRVDGITFVVIKEKTRWHVFAEGCDTGYKFDSLKKAYEYCEFGY